jgi:hypothetical protein
MCGSVFPNLILRRYYNMKKRIFSFSIVLMVLIAVSSVQAVFIVETHDSGRGYANFTPNGAPGYSSFTVSDAVGCIGTQSAYGGDNYPDLYTFYYTPGTDADNYTMTEGTDLGNGVVASGLTGGETGFYNVYVSWPSSTNVSGGPTKITVSSDDDDVIVYVIQDGDQPDATPGDNEWVLVGQGVTLTQGVTYTVLMEPTYDTLVSMRAQGVMWEKVPAMPSDPAPAHLSTDVPLDQVFTWAPVSGTPIESQAVVLALDSGMQDVVGTYPAVDNSVTIPDLRNNTVYYWRVDSDGTEGVVWMFSTESCIDGPGFTEGDINEDCKVDFKDFYILAANWLTSGSHE